ncbi:MAG: acyltransferase, partial [Candidatus Nanopelagicales bacterium]
MGEVPSPTVAPTIRTETAQGLEAGFTQRLDDLPEVTAATADRPRLERSGGVHVRGLDGYRALAALFVLTTHVSFTTGVFAYAPLGAMMSRLDIGVTVFFVLSGFLLYRPWSVAAMTGRSAPGNRRYAWRRATRILPAYWAVIVVTLLVLPEIRPVSFHTWWAHLGLLQIYASDGPVEGLTQTWSLATEVSFYIALPVIAWLATRRHRGDADRSARHQLLVIGALAVVGVGYQLVHVVGPLAQVKTSGYWLPGYLDWFAAGMTLAVISSRLSISTDAPGAASALVRRLTVAASFGRDTWTCLALATAAFVIVCTPVGGGYGFDALTPWSALVRHFLYSVAATAFLAPAMLAVDSSGAWHRFISHPVMRYLGRISYGIFLWHLMLLRLLLPVTG